MLSTPRAILQTSYLVAYLFIHAEMRRGASIYMNSNIERTSDCGHLEQYPWTVLLTVQIQRQRKIISSCNMVLLAREAVAS